MLGKTFFLKYSLGLGIALFLFASPSQALSKASTISTFTGNGTAGFIGENLTASSSAVELNTPASIVSNSSSTIFYIADTLNHVVRKIDAQGIISTIAGTGTAGFLGENVTASTVTVQFNTPRGIALDSAGNIYISDTKNHRIRKIDTKNNITTIAGNGTAGFFGESINANGSGVKLNEPAGLIVDSTNNLYFADSLNHCIRKIDPSGIITTFAGNCGTQGYGGENVSATSTLTLLNSPQSVAIDSTGMVYIADTNNHRIRKVKQGIINTVAGNGTAGFAGENIPPDTTNVEFNSPLGVMVNELDNVFIADTGNHRIRRINVSSNIILTIAGTGVAGYSGDNGDSSLSQLNFPSQMSMYNQILVFADTKNNRIRKIDNNYTITATRTGSGSGTITATAGVGFVLNCGSVCSASFTPSTNATLTATADVGSTFTGWSGDCTGTTSTATVTVSTDLSCTANFNSSGSGGSGSSGGTTGGTTGSTPPTGSILTVGRQGAGTGIISAGQGLLNTGIFCGGVCLEIYTPNTPLTLTTTAATGSLFTGWSGDCSITGSVVLDTNKNCVATFDLLPATTYPSSVQFSTPSYSISAAQGKVSLLVTRAASSSGALSVEYSMADGTAVAGKDYTSSTNTLNWADGENTPKAIDIPLLVNSDANLADTADFSVSLANVSAGASVGTNPKATVTITRSPSSGAGSVQFSGSNFSANAGSGSASIQVQRIGGSTGAVSVQYASSAGSAVNATNYTNVNGTLNWSAGDTQDKSFSVPLLVATPQGGDKTVNLNLSNPSGGTNLGAVSAATLTILDSTASGSTVTSSTPGQFAFYTSSYSVAKNAGYVSVTVTRINGSQGAVSVDYSTVDGTAIAGVNYTRAQSTLTWAAGDTQSKSFSIPVLQDAQQSTDKNFTVVLSNPTAGAQLGGLSSTTVQITNTTAGASGGTTDTPTSTTASVLQLASPSYTIGKSMGLVTLTVSRTVGTVGDLTVSYVTQDGTALAGKDYLAAQGTLRWATGDTTDRQIMVGIYNNAMFEGDKTFTVKLGTVTGNASLGGNTLATVLIKDTNTTTGVQFSASNYSVDSSQRAAIITISRYGSAVGKVSVSYVSLDGTGIAGTDYSAVSGVLTWDNGDNLDKTISVPLISNAATTDNKTVTLHLTALGNNVLIGDHSDATLNIINSTPTPANCKPSGNTVNCFYTNADTSTLTDFHVLTQGILQGGTLSGTTTNEGIIQNINLSAGAIVNGGTLKGEILGQNIDPISLSALLNQVTIVEGTRLSNVIIGRGSSVSPKAIFLDRVRFEDNGTIPSVSDLSNALGKFETSIFGTSAVRLSGDILLNSAKDGILSTINSLYDLNNNQYVLTQRSDTGFLELSLNNDSLRYAVLPTQVLHILGKQALEHIPLGISIREDGYIRFITYTGRQIDSHPVVQTPAALANILASLGFPNIAMQSTGNLKVTDLSNDGSYYSARADLIATASTGRTGLFNQVSPLAAAVNILRFVFVSPNGGGVWQQFIYPAAADPNALYNLSADKQSVLYNTGEALLYQTVDNAQKTYHGIFHYLVTKGTPPASGKVEVTEMPDLNQDARSDYIITYANGDQQVLYGLP